MMVDGGVVVVERWLWWIVTNKLVNLLTCGQLFEIVPNK